MQPHERITAALRASGEKDCVPIVAYVTAGFPEPAKFIELLDEVCDCAEVVEIGVPFTDPMADGVTIQRASHAALEAGVSLSWILEQLRGRAEPPRAPLMLMSYLNPLLAYGLDRLMRDARDAHVSGFIVPDLPLEESGPFREAADAVGLALVQLVTPVTQPDRLEALCRASKGFVYAVTITGITGGEVEVPEDMLAYLDRVRAVSEIPVCAGFGIRSAAQVERIGAHAGGVIVGSALVECLERGESPGAFLDSLRGRP